MKRNLPHPAVAASGTQSILPHQPLCRRSFVLWMRLLLLMLPAAVQAQFTYTTNNGTITISGYIGPGGSVTIPNLINGLPVTRIGDKAFYYSTNVTSIIIGANVTSIGEDAFSSSSLTSVTIPNSVTNIGNRAFF